MKKILFCFYAVAPMFISGCADWFRDDRPIPVKPPYEQVQNANTGTYSDADAVNAMTTAIAMQTTFRNLGPFVFVQDKNRPCSKLGEEVIVSLYRMGISTSSARLMLVFYDTITPQGEWTVSVVHYKTDKVFFTRTLQLSRRLNGSNDSRPAR